MAIHVDNKSFNQGSNKKDAIEAAIDYCIKNDILADILTKHRSEVMGSILHYDEKQHMKTVRQEGYEDGYEAASEARQKEIDELNSTFAATIADREATIADKEATIADKETTISNQKAMLADKDAEIMKLRMELKKLQNK